MDIVRDQSSGTVLRAGLYGLGMATMTGLLIGLPTDLIPNPIFGRMIEARPQDYVFLVITVLLTGLLGATYAFPASCPFYEGRFAASGLLSFLAVGCPTCNKLVVLALGSSGALTWFEPIQPLLAVASIGLLGLALTIRVRAVRGG